MACMRGRMDLLNTDWSRLVVGEGLMYHDLVHALLLRQSQYPQGLTMISLWKKILTLIEIITQIHTSHTHIHTLITYMHTHTNIYDL